MLKHKPMIACALCIANLHLIPSSGFATTQSADSQPSIRITLPDQKNSLIRLEARQAPLGQILKQITEKTGVLIHYSVLPEAPVTATCVGASIGQVMDCLVAKQIGLISNSPQQGKPTEFWLLGSSVGSCQAMTIEPRAPIPVAKDLPPERTQADQAQIDQVLQEQSDEILKQAKAKDPVQRAEAITNLISGGVKDDPNIRKTLVQALTDKDANVRAQAITALAKREGENAAPELRQALKDTDVSVRLMAVDNAGNDADLLQQALADKDPMIRNHAASKLAALNNVKSNGN